MEATVSRRYTVLVVDDNPQLTRLMALGLPDFGDFDVVTAEDGIEGLTKCAELQPACMVLDVMMPGLDGYQLVRALRGDPATAHIPLILLTAKVQEKDQYIGLASGADQYLCKPVLPSELSRAIYVALHIGTAERENRQAALAEEPFETPGKR
jgi:CheY-like chemotaxis protein